MGRVNGIRRLTYAKAIGCSSVDGADLARFWDGRLTHFLAQAALPAQMILDATLQLDEPETAWEQPWENPKDALRRPSRPRGRRQDGD
jgi:hypothetical protein